TSVGGGGIRFLASFVVLSTINGIRFPTRLINPQVVIWFARVPVTGFGKRIRRNFGADRVGCVEEELSLKQPGGRGTHLSHNRIMRGHDDVSAAKLVFFCLDRQGFVLDFIHLRIFVNVAATAWYCL